MTTWQIYPETRSRIRRLSAKGLESTWDPAWITGAAHRISPPRFLSERLYAQVISQFMHGERTTVRMCRRLMDVLDDADCRQFLETQIDDEMRHAAAYEFYLDHIGGPMPMDPNLNDALERILGWPDAPQGWLLGFHILLEGEVLRSFAKFQAFWPCPVLAEMNARISQDEARHVAFGKLFLKDTLRQLPANQRHQLGMMVKSLWQEAGAAILSGVHVPGVFTGALRRRWLADGWDHHRRALADIGLTGPDMAEMPAADAG